MDKKVQSLLDKARAVADKTGEAASRAAGVAGKKTMELADTARLSFKSFDLNAECDALYREIGKKVYALHCGAEVSNDELDEKFDELDKKRASLESLQAEIAAKKDTVICPLCGRKCAKKDAFCAGCGAVL